MKHARHLVVQCLVIAICLLVAGSISPLLATNLTGTFKNPDGSPVNGKLIFLLSQPARLSDGSAQIVPMVKIFTVTNGALQAGAFVFGNDVLVPSGTYYLVRLVDNSNNLLFEQKWVIQGTNLDLGAMTPTTVGVVVPDPLVKNSTTDQAVQGPVTFSGPVTAFSLILSGDLNPATASAYSLGSTATPWREVIADQVSVKGPRPWVDVRAFGAKGDGNTDDTQAFINAITFAAQNGGAVYIPPAEGSAPDPSYKITSTIDVGTIMVAAGSNSLHFIGGHTIGKNIASFSRPPRTNIRMWQVNSPLFLMDMAGADRSVTLENLDIKFKGETGRGVQGVVYKRGSFVSFINTSITVQFDASVADNAAVLIEDTIWVRFQVGSYSVDNSGGSGRPIILRGQNPAATNLVGIVNMENVTLVGGGIRYHQETPMGGSAGTYTFKEVFTESSAVPLLELTKGPTVSSYSLGGLILINCVLADSIPSGTTLPLVRVSADNARVDSLTILGGSSLGVELTGSGASIRTMNHFPGPGGALSARYSSGLPVGGASLFKREGVDFFAKTDAAIDDQSERLINDANSLAGPTLRIFRDKEASSPLQLLTEAGAVSLALGVGKGWRGWDVELQRDNDPANVELDFNFAEVNGPAVATANATTGGTLAPGTYYYRIEARGAITNFYSGAGPEKSVTVAAPNNAVSLSWSAVSGASQYRIHRFSWSQTTLGLVHTAGNSKCVDTASTSITDDGSWPTCTTFLPENSTITNRHRMTRTSLALNNPTGTGNGALYIENATAAQTPVDIQARSDTTAGNLFRIGRTGVSADIFRVGLDQNTKVRGQIWFQNGTSFQGIFAHSNTASRTYTFPDATGTIPLLSLTQTWTAQQTFSQPLVSTIATGTAPLTVTSATEVPNLNAQKWHGKDAIDFSATLDFGSIAAQACSQLTISATGASAGNPVAPAWPTTLESGLTGIMFVSGADTVAVRLCNPTSAAMDPASQTFGGRVIK